MYRIVAVTFNVFLFSRPICKITALIKLFKNTNSHNEAFLTFNIGAIMRPLKPLWALKKSSICMFDLLLFSVTVNITFSLYISVVLYCDSNVSTTNL